MWVGIRCRAQKEVGCEKGQPFLQGRWESQKVIDKIIAKEVEEERGKEVRSPRFEANMS